MRDYCSGFHTPPSGQQSTRDDSSPPNDSRSIEQRLRLLPVIGTFLVAILAVGAVWILWQNYMGTPWTRDGTVRAYIVTLAPEVSGRIVELDVRDNQYVHAGDMLMKIDPRDYRVAVDLSKAAVDEAQADYDNKKIQADRRLALSDLATSIEARQSYVSSAAMASAALEQQKANLERATVNLARTEIRSPVTGWVTNLLARQGDYAATGQTAMSLVDADSFWVDGYFEETALKLIHEGDPATIWLLGFGKCCRDMWRALRAASSYQTPHREKAALRLSTPSSPGCGWRSAFRYACTSTLSHRMSGSSWV